MLSAAGRAGNLIGLRGVCSQLRERSGGVKKPELRLAFGPLALQHARVFAGGKQVELETEVRDVLEFRSALARGKQLVGVAVIVAHKLMGQGIALRRRGKNRAQTQRARENGLVVRHSPLAELGLDIRRRLTDEIGREALVLDSGSA